METVLEKTQSVLLHNISWNAYTQIADSIQEFSPAHVTFDRGNLEIMVLSMRHERLKKIVGLLFERLCEALDIEVFAVGSTTFRRQDLERGFEPDECYYIANAQLIKSRESIDLEFDPPPDLTIEVDVSSSSLNRLRMFAAVGIPEVWRYKDRRLTMYLLKDGVYEVSETSRVVEGAANERLSELVLIGLTASRKEFVCRVEEYADEIRKR